MNTSDQIHEAYKTAKNYPDLVSKLIEVGVLSYTVDTCSGIILYRFANGENVIHHNQIVRRTINDKFDETHTVQAIRDNQQGRSNYPEFMNEIAKAGVLFYEATLNGDNKRVTYIGNGGFYEERIPL